MCPSWSTVPIFGCSCLIYLLNNIGLLIYVVSTFNYICGGPKIILSSKLTLLLAYYIVSWTYFYEKRKKELVEKWDLLVFENIIKKINICISPW